MREEGKRRSDPYALGSGRSGRTVLYLDVDDTLLRYPGGRDQSPEPAPGASEFLSWALDRFEVRWLTRWCRTGRMEGDLLASFCKLLGADPETIGAIRGVDWSCGDTKLDGIAWLDHLVLGRRFIWIEDEYGLREREREFLGGMGYGDVWIHCNVTETADALESVHRELRRKFGAEPEESDPHPPPFIIRSTTRKSST